MKVIWKFKTANLRVTLEIMDEEMDPADSFEFEEDIAAVRNGDVEWFCAVVRVCDKNGHELGWDSLGGCAYESVREFYTSHRDAGPMNRNCSVMRAAKGQVNICHYFPEMVSIACSKARQHLEELRSIRVRANA